MSHSGQSVAVPVWQCYPGSFGKGVPHQWAPTRLTRVWVQGAHGAEIPGCCDICRPASLTGNPSRKSLEAGRILGRVQTCPARLLPGISGGCGGTGRAGVSPGVPGAVTLQDELQPAVLCACGLLGRWDTRNGGRGLCPAFFQPQWLPAAGALVLYPSSRAVQDPSPSLGSTGWLCFGTAVGIQGMLRDTGMTSHAAFLPLTPPRAVRKVGVRFSGLGSDPPHRLPTTSSSLPTLGLDVPTSPSTFGSLCHEPRWAHPAHQNPQHRRGPLPWPPGWEPRESGGAGKGAEWEQKVRGAAGRGERSRRLSADPAPAAPAPASPRCPHPLLPTSALPGSAPRSTWSWLRGGKAISASAPVLTPLPALAKASRGRVGAHALCPSVTVGPCVLFP